MAFSVSCPECGTQFSLIQALEDTDGRLWVDLVKDLPPVVIKPMIRYLKLFKPTKQVMRWSRMLKLTREIAPMIKAAQIERERISYVVTPATWANAMTYLAETPPPSLKLPLKSHGYLLSILVGNAEKAVAQKEIDDDANKRYRAREHADNEKAEKLDAQKMFDAHMKKLGVSTQGGNND